MTIEIRVPALPESVTDATLVAWHKKPGEAVSRDENLVDLETDKVVLEVPAPVTGTITEIRVKDGATVVAGDLLAILEEGEGAEVAVTPVAEKTPEPLAAPASQSAAAKLSPSVRRLLDEHDLDATVVIGSGKEGRITKSDVVSYLKNHSDENVAPGDPPPELVAATMSAGPSRTEQRVPMTRLRARIAERMVEAQRSAAMLTTFNEVDLTKVMSLRSRYKEAFEKEHGVRLGFMSFFAKASVEALKKFPAVNASIEGNDIIYHDYVDIGIAVSSERGLMVPVLRNVDHSSFAKIESDINHYAGKARDGSMSMEDLTGGTFTITNGGIFGSMLSTPILNPPQSAILGMHNIQERAVVVDGEIVIRPMMYLALTYDHRIIDGKEAVQFLVSIKNSLEDPGRLLLQV
ncbi:MAG: 2-oxoglutarate dehydrogenase complex dihydrolipoyllysine-residue succinyltransferase [Proteobacteria bacterium]|nr:2-oxoglutarate dehydrogenase complex dihydrolipoyllysine-residue succinyltransferase [Pseudomonadota bacterium]MDA0993493.1 2-oxoglutarate dehydrogenase complex dihydrolipoyllysine-residue succinyltransferase [Pseudomonadota bacterium]